MPRFNGRKCRFGLPERCFAFLVTFSALSARRPNRFQIGVVVGLLENDIVTLIKPGECIQGTDQLFDDGFADIHGLKMNVMDGQKLSFFGLLSHPFLQ